ncbi:LysR family transcriptional regulator [Halomonas sp. V046]|uniref:LysR family transcriptional regulator n=1 Tax=Halomonas sp. V046 TaxID=3459611 RepID=UPI0040440F44
MNLNHLQSLVTLTEERHFVRAAERLGISQSALSQQVQKIERELGFALFRRSQRQVLPTEAGRIFVEEAIRVLRQYELAIATAGSAAKGAIGRLRLGFVENAALHVLPRSVSRFRKQHPLVQLELTEMISDELGEAVRDGTLDAALMRPLGLDDTLRHLTLLREPYHVALNSDHPLVEREAIDFGQIAAERMIIASGNKAKYIRSVFQPLCERLGVELAIAQEVNQLHAIIGLVASGLGYTLLPRSATALRIEGVVYRPLADRDAPHAELMLVWSPETTNPVLKNFLAIARGMTQR